MREHGQLWLGGARVTPPQAWTVLQEPLGDSTGKYSPVLFASADISRFLVEVSPKGGPQERRLSPKSTGDIDVLGAVEPWGHKDAFGGQFVQPNV